MIEKRPRHYAAEYLACKTNQQREGVIQTIPEHYKKIVKEHIKTARGIKRVRNRN